MSTQTFKTKTHSPHQMWVPPHECAVCGSKAIGINFGAPTCAPCKAFFRRNARRHEVRQMPCQIFDSDHPIDENKDQDDTDSNYKECSQLRRCTSCRLRRCFSVGMKEELVRTEEEKQRYRQLIESNRQRRREISKLHESSDTNASPDSKIIIIATQLLEENDWRLLSNIVNAYDTYCLKIFTEHRKEMFEKEMKTSDEYLSKIDHHVAARVMNIKSYLSFLSSMPIIQSLSNSNRLYLCKHNVRALIFLNTHELEQACFSEPWQLDVDNTAAEQVYGKVLFADCMRVKTRAVSMLINDPAVTRLWLLILFFSTPLNCYYERALPEISRENRLDLNQIQDSLTLLLWNYLMHRHGCLDAIRIFSNLVRIYLQMQQFSRAVNHQARTRHDLFIMNQAFNRAIVFERDF